MTITFTYFKFQNTDKPSEHKSRKNTRLPLILFQKQHCFSQGSWCPLFDMLKAVTSLKPFPFLLGLGAYYLFKQSPKCLRSLMVHQQPRPRSQRNLRFGEFSQQVSSVLLWTIMQLSDIAVSSRLYGYRHIGYCCTWLEDVCLLVVRIE